MGTCFLFIQELDSDADFDTIFSLKLNSDGEVEASPAYRTASEISTLQQGAKTTIVLQGQACSIHEVSLPWISEGKARAAIPYALEEQLAQPVNQLHFAFDRYHYQNNRYLVAVINQQLLRDLIDWLESAGISFNEITCEWFALDEGDAILTDQNLLVYHSDFKGTLARELIEPFLDEKSNSDLSTHGFPNSAQAAKKHIKKLLNETSHEWLAKKLLTTHPIHFCQGMFKQTKNTGRGLLWYKASAVLLGLWVVSMIAFDWVEVTRLNKKMSALDDKIKVIYMSFFPQAKQVISPKFRIEQALKPGSSGHGNGLWHLLSQLEKTYDSSSVSIHEIRYQNDRLSVDLSSPDFMKLEAFEKKLRLSHISVDQIQASTKNGSVIATLELK